MPDRKCPKCGSEVPEGSKFCNHCGSIIDIPDMQCPECGAIIPGDSRECPNCHEAVEPKVKNPNAWGDQNGDEDEPKDHRVRNIVIGVVVVAFLALFAVNKIFYSHDTNMEENSGIIDTNGDDQSLIDIFNQTLEKNDLKNDGDRIAYVLPIPSENSENSKMVGVTYLSDKVKSFYRIYELNRNGNEWTIAEKAREEFAGRALVFDKGELRATREMPAIVNVGGKNYFYFCYAVIPEQTAQPGASGKVVSVLYDYEASKIACKQEFSGSIENAADGMPQIKTEEIPHSSGLLDAKLVELAAYIGYLHLPTPEEVKLIEQKQVDLQNNQAKQDSIQQAQAQQTAAINSGATMTAPTVQEFDKDNPQFRAEDFARKINGAGYTIFLLKNGKVWAYNQSSQKSFEVSVGEAASDIGWEDSGAGVLNVRTSSGKMQYNLNTHTFKKVE